MVVLIREVESAGLSVVVRVIGREVRWWSVMVVMIRGG